MFKNDGAVRKAESLLAEVVTPQGQSGNTPDEAQWSSFKPQANLAPVLLDTGQGYRLATPSLQKKYLLQSW